LTIFRLTIFRLPLPANGHNIKLMANKFLFVNCRFSASTLDFRVRRQGWAGARQPSKGPPMIWLQF
jgi:hypothetical protein